MYNQRNKLKIIFYLYNFKVEEIDEYVLYNNADRKNKNLTNAVTKCSEPKDSINVI